jgi:hypothetical protein
LRAWESVVWELAEEEVVDGDGENKVGNAGLG